MKNRLDLFLVETGIADSRRQAQTLITSGLVKVNGDIVHKSSAMVDDESHIEISGKGCPYVSRGGLKLAGGLDYFNIDTTGWICADIGASTGGFTDCLLQLGAARVYAIDVGYGQLDWKLRNDPRVIVMERTNARNIKADDLPESIDFAVIDASFISLKLLLAPALTLFRDKASILALIKPQFEVGREKVGKGGVVRDPDLHEAVIEEITGFAESLGLKSHGVCLSPILGPKGNKEFLIYLTKNYI